MNVATGAAHVTTPTTYPQAVQGIDAAGGDVFGDVRGDAHLSQSNQSTTTVP
jgi:hypothetical protein